MSNVVTGIEAIKKANEIMKMSETKILVSAYVDNSVITVYSFLDNYYFSAVHDVTYRSVFEKITKQEALNIKLNILNIVHRNNIKFGGF